MRRVGEVVRIAQGLAVVRGEDADIPAVGTTLVDDQLTDRGSVVDVFGPVDRPYLAISPTDEAPAPLLGTVLYAR